MNFSAKKLISCSASQLCWMNEHPEKQTDFKMTPWVIQGQIFQEQLLEKLGRNLHTTEMGGSYTTKHGDTIYFSHDIVANDGMVIIESKRLLDKETPSCDYLNKSILQCVVYDVLTRFSSPILRKSKFARDSYSDKVITLKKAYKYCLRMGRFAFIIKLINPYPILSYIEDKTLACRNYSTAKTFDCKWKGKEFEILRNCFEVKQI